MAPENPATYTLDDDGRLLIPKRALPAWLDGPTQDGELFCVPIRWRRPTPLLAGRELQAWCLWSEKAGGKWVIDPREVRDRATKDPVSFALQVVIYPARYDSKGRLSCAGIFNAMGKHTSTREFWVAAEADTVSIWTDAAFQWSYANLGIEP